jgi:6-phosphogluconate dehydrogenase
MQFAMIGLGRMGGDMVRRLIAGGHTCIVYDRSPEAVAALVADGAGGARTLAELVERLVPPRTLWLMLPAAAVDPMLAELVPLLRAGDIVVDGGNSFYRDDVRRAGELAGRGISYVDVGTSGGVWGRKRGYCLMIGGDPEAVAHLEPLFRTLAPGKGAAPPLSGNSDQVGTAEQGYLHCGPGGAGHFVKMVHNGIEYGLMAAYAEGFNILRQAGAGRGERDVDAETAPLLSPEYYRYDFDVAAIAELWRRGSVVSSWLLDLAAGALLESPDLAVFQGRVADSGEGRWTVEAAIDEGVPAPVLSAALFSRFSSRGADDFANRFLSALRYEFGGHREKALEPRGEA